MKSRILSSLGMALLVLLGGASSVSAVSLSIVADAETYAVGDTITLNIVYSESVVSPTPYDDMEGGYASSHAYLQIDASLSVSGTANTNMLSATQYPMREMGHWTDFESGDGDFGTYDYPVSLDSLSEPFAVVNQNAHCVAFIGENYGWSQNCGIVIPSPIAIATFSADAAGEITFGWSPSTSIYLEYDELSYPSTFNTATITITPEPSTALLLGIGLTALSIKRRRTS